MTLSQKTLRPMTKLFVSILFCVLSFSASAEALKLRTVSQDNSLVKYNVNNQMQLGICAEILKKIEELVPTIKFVGTEKNVPIQRIEQFLEKDEIDIFFCLLKTKDRERRFRYVDIPLYPVRNAVLVKANDPILNKKIKTLKDLKNEGVILVNKGSALIDDLKKSGVKYSDGGKDDAQILELLDANRGRFFYGQDATLKFMLKEKKDKDNYRIIVIPEKKIYQYVVYSKKLDKKIVDKITVAIRKLQLDGTLDRIYQKHVALYQNNSWSVSLK